MPPTGNHPRYSKPGGIDWQFLRVRIRCYRLFEEVVDEIFKPCIFSSSKTTLKNGTKAEPVLQEQPKIAFCTANVPGENHGRLILHVCLFEVFQSRQRLNGFPSLFLRDA